MKGEVEMSFWSDKNVLITGGSGFLGSHAIEKLKQRRCAQIAAPTSHQYNLIFQDHVEEMMNVYQPQIVIHLAAAVGGIGANQKHPGSFFYWNMQMGINIINACKQYRKHYNTNLEKEIGCVEKLVLIGTVCAYPKFCPRPFVETDLWNGYPEETNAPYGIAKRALLTMAQAYRQEYDLHSIYLLPTNLYGPKDSFELEKSHVIPALIKKLNEAKDNHDSIVKIWGTGLATRDFLYVDDAVDGILDATEKYDQPEPINLGSGEEWSIKSIAEIISNLVGYKGQLEFDPSMPDGQPWRLLDTSRAREEFNWSAKTPLEIGLKKTIEWYEENHGKI